MPIVMRLKKNRCCPCVICDFCHQEIIDAKDGNCQWDMGEDAKGTGATLYFTHKKCCDAFEDANPEVCWGAEMLDHFMVFLSNNVRLDRESAEKGARLLASLG